jgi:multicomponent Na+:H+ antiporter subunit A
MVKGGIYLLARLHPTLAGTPAWIWILTVAGTVTAVWSAVVSLRQTDLKVALAWTTVMALGTLVLFLGSEAEAGLVAAVTFLLVHALYKCTLFLVVGNVDHATGTREVGRLGLLARAMPVTAAAAVVAGFSMAGFPPFLGFLGKELKYEGALAVSSEPWLAASASVLANALMVALAGIVAVRPFFRPGGTPPRKPHEADAFMLAGPIVLSALGLILGLLPDFVSSAVVEPAVSAITGRDVVLKLKLWHGINLPLVLSTLTVAIGLAIYRFHPHLRRLLARGLDGMRVTGNRVYEWTLTGLARVAEAHTRWMQPGRLRAYLLVIFATLVAVVGGTWIVRGISLPAVDAPRLSLPTWGVAALVAAGTLTVLVARTRLVAVCALSLVGAGLALIFVVYGQPDVAITQLMVDILVVAILTLVLPRLPRFRGRAHGGARTIARDALIATAVGVLMAALVLAVGTTGFDHSLTEYYEAKSVPEAYGRNIVNVILVDFRALDTLGEIVVLALAGLAAWGLLQRGRGPR